MKKTWTSSKICEKKMTNTLSTTHARMAVWKLKTWSRQRLDDWMFTSGCSQECAHKSTLRVPIYCAGQVRGRLSIVSGAPSYIEGYDLTGQWSIGVNLLRRMKTLVLLRLLLSRTAIKSSGDWTFMSWLRIATPSSTSTYYSFLEDNQSTKISNLFSRDNLANGVVTESTMSHLTWKPNKWYFVKKYTHSPATCCFKESLNVCVCVCVCACVCVCVCVCVYVCVTKKKSARQMASTTSDTGDTSSK